MTVTLNLTPEEEARLHEVAAHEGIVAEEYLLRVVKKLLPMEPQPKRVLRGYGKYAHLPGGAEDFARQKQEEIAHEEEIEARRS